MRSFTTDSARSGITSHAMLRTTCSDINCTTRRAMRSTCSSVSSPPDTEALLAAGEGDGAGSAGGGDGGGGGVHTGGSGIGGGAAFFKSSKLMRGKARVSPAGRCSSHGDDAAGEEEAKGGSVSAAS